MSVRICPNTGTYCSRYEVLSAVTEALETRTFRPADFGVIEDLDVVRNRHLEQIVNTSELQGLVKERGACVASCALAQICDVADYVVIGPQPHARAC